MIQATDRFSSRNPAPSAGKLSEFTSGGTELNAGGSVRVEFLDELAGYDVDRLNAITNRATSLKRLMQVLSFSDEFSEEVQDLFRMIGREADAIYALGIQRDDRWRNKQ